MCKLEIEWSHGYLETNLFIFFISEFYLLNLFKMLNIFFYIYIFEKVEVALLDHICNHWMIDDMHGFLKCSLQSVIW